MTGFPADSVTRGPHPVGVLTLELDDPGRPGRKLPVDLWYPADPSLRGQDLLPGATRHQFGQPHAALSDAAAAPGRFPIIAFSHGNGGLREQSTFLTTQLASWGFAVIAPDHVGNTFFEMAGLDEQARKSVHLESRENRPRDLETALHAALAGGTGFPELDGTRIGALGHSFGGWTAMKLSRRVPALRAVCGLAPVSEPFVGRKAFEPGELPFRSGIASLIVAGIDDVLVDLETSVRPLFDRLNAPVALLGVAGADHYHFCDGLELLHAAHLANPRANQHRPTRALEELLPQERMHRLVCGVVTAFFRAALDPAVEAPLGAFDSGALAALDPALRLLGQGHPA